MPVTISDINQLLKIVSESHGWKHYYKNIMSSDYAVGKVKLFKYIDFTLDTRDMEIWSITFRGGGKDKTFYIESKEELDGVIKWLNNKKKW